MSEPGVRIDVRRSGGLAGITMRASIDAGELPADDAAAIEGLVRRLELSEVGPARSTGADRFQYGLTVTRGDERHELSVGEQQLSPELRRVLDGLLSRRSS